MLNKVVEAIFGSKHKKDLKELLPLLHKVNEKEMWAVSLKDEEFRSFTEQFRKRIADGESLDDILPEAFALCREAARRVLGERPYDVQILGGIILHQGKIIEMKTGEGKTLASVTAAYLNALSGKGVHIVTVNDYLAERDAQWMGKVHNFLGISVGTALSNMDAEAKNRAYRCDITYATNNELGFDYLRDNMRWSDKQKIQRGHNFAIVDEIDSILIDEARTPLIISGAAEDDTSKFYQVDKLVRFLDECEKDPETEEYPENPSGDYKLEEKTKRALFTDAGMNKIESLLLKNHLIEGSLFTDENFEYIHYFTQALKAHKLFHKDVDYVVQGGGVQIVDEFTGRILTGRRYSDGLHQAIEAKEKIKVARKNRTLATTTFQNYFRMYDKLCGMTGTADTEAREFAKIYDLDVVVVPTNRPVIRVDADDEIYLNEDFKFKAICDEIENVSKKGQPVLVGTVSIEKSELLSSMLSKRGIRHEVLNAKNHAREAMIISEAGAKSSVTIATNMAGRGTDIKLGGNPEFLARKAAGTEASPEEYKKAFEKELLKWKKNYEEIRKLGGLYVIGTERHESRRIDNQLRGRSGRQGDPGKSKFYISLDDMLMRLFGGENIKSMMSKIGMKDNEPIKHPWISKSIGNAQKRVEERNYEIRKHLLDYDNVLGEHRKFIYSQREDILADTNFIDRLKGIVRDFADDFFEDKKDIKEISAIAAKFKETLFYNPLNAVDIKGIESLGQFKQAVIKNIESDLDEKASKLGSNNFNLFCKMEYLRIIDSKWQEHLENLESLREAVNLRAYGQKNPLLEYKLEGFDIFDKMIDDIRKIIVRKVINIKIEKYDERSRSDTVSIATHQETAQFAAHGGSSAGVSSDAAPVQVIRSMPKVGRNDPCPCGSGKKYKRCHGA